MNCREYLLTGTAKLSIDLCENTADLLCRYYRELDKWGRKINLVAKASEPDILESHFLDSLTLLPLLPESDMARLLDIGSGAGFPGLPLKIARPQLHVTLVEPRLKRVSFLKHVIRTLGLRHIEVIPNRLAPNDSQFSDRHGTFDFITCRAFTSIRDFLDIARPFSAPTGEIICMKGLKASEELNEWQGEYAEESPFICTEQLSLTLPDSCKQRKLLVFREKSFAP